MGLGDKVRNTAEDVAGKVKEHVGRATDDDELEAEGQAQQAKAALKQSAEHAKDAARDILDK